MNKTQTETNQNPKASLLFLTYNLRYESDRGIRKVKCRMPHIIEKIKDLTPDVIGCQEAQFQHIAALRTAFAPEYALVYCYRQNPNLMRPHPESSPILYRKDKFDLLTSGHFWLSETPDVMSKMPGAHNFRICTWVQLKERLTGKEFFYYNLHFDFGEAQKKSLPVLLGRIEKEGTVVVGGDFNLSPVEENYRVITSQFSDSRLVSEKDAETGTYHGYHSPSSDIINHIDFLFYRGDISAVSHKVICDDEKRWGEGIFASDHYPVLVEFLL